MTGEERNVSKEGFSTDSDEGLLYPGIEIVVEEGAEIDFVERIFFGFRFDRLRDFRRGSGIGHASLHPGHARASESLGLESAPPRRGDVH